MISKDDYVVRAGASVIAVRKNWGAAQDSVDAYIRDLLKAGTRYVRTRSQTHKTSEGKSIHAIYHYVGDAKGAFLVVTINRGS